MIRAACPEHGTTTSDFKWNSFDGTDGKYPYGSFVTSAKGTLFGTTRNGGTIGYGTVWKMSKVSARQGE